MMLLPTLRKLVFTREKIWDQKEEGKNESDDTNNKHTHTHTKCLASKALTTVRRCCLNKVNLSPKLQNSHCCSVCKLRPKSVYTRTQLCMNSDPNLDSLRAREPCESRSGHLGLPRLSNSPYGLLDVKQHLKREKNICIYKLRNIQRLYIRDKLALQSVPNMLFSI